jgi:D-psicose/D-tagatose/L-ribulose 3-epimerase
MKGIYMKLGMNLLLWTAAATEKHMPLIEKIKGWGFDGVEFPMFTPDCSPWDTLKKQMKDLGMSSTVVAVLPAETSLVAEEAAPRKRALDHLRESIDSCTKLGAETLAGPIFHPVGQLAGRGPTAEERKRLVEGLRALAPHAEGAKVKIAVEPLNRFETYVLNSQADAKAVSDAVNSPMVGHMYDTFHANIEEKGIEAAVRAGGKRILHVHVSANDRATPGEDHIDYATTFRALRGIGYDGWLTIEAFGEWLPELAGATCIWRKMAPSEEHIAREGAKFVRAAWAKANH